MYGDENEFDLEKKSPVDLKAYLQGLYEQKGLGDEQRGVLEQSAKDAAPGAGTTFLASLGAGLAGQNQASAVDALGAPQKARQGELDAFDKKRSGVFDDLKKDREIGKFERESKDEAAMSDPGSQESKIAQSLAKRIMPKGDFENQSAATINKMLPNLNSIFKSELDSQRRAEDVDLKKQEIGVKRADVRAAKDEKDQIMRDELTTPYGEALTKSDAKDVKDAYIEKRDFDSKLQEMIDLRKKHGGGAILNRTDVSRGKQLSKELLLSYKNMAKLGILSKSDEDIINAVIPDDPLAYSFAIGEDPILSNMEKFMQTAQDKFNTGIETRIKKDKRIEPAGMKPQAGEKPQTVTQNGHTYTLNPETGEYE